MDWDLLKSFESVARNGSLSGAARELKSSPATVGRHIATLEASLEASLFDRLPEGYAITAAGDDFLPMAQDMAAVADRISRKRAALGASTRSVVRIAAGNWFSRILLRHAGEAGAALPGIELEIANEYGFANLARREADIAIRNRRPERGRLVIRRLPGFASAIYGHRDYVAANPDAAEDARYRTCRWVGFDDELAHLPSARWLAERRDDPPQMRCLQAMNILDGVLGGGGLGIFPCFIGDGESALERVSPPFSLDGADAWLVIHEDLKRVPAIRAVADWTLGLLHDHCAAVSKI